MGNQKYCGKTIHWDGRDWTYSEAAAHLDITLDTMQWRIRNGWSVEKIMNTRRQVGRPPPYDFRAARQKEADKKAEHEAKVKLEHGLCPNEIYALTLKWVPNPGPPVI